MHTISKVPPFSGDVLGTYSHHGIEPVSNVEASEDAVHDKINQDRGCVVYPFNGSGDESLLMVLDGHGEQGDRVSEFTMRNVSLLFLFLVLYI